MKAAVWKKQQVMGWPEKELQEEVLRLASRLGWWSYHTFNSQRSTPGFPDLLLVNRRQRRSMFRELKRTGKKPTAAQANCLDLLEIAGHDVGVWRPEDWLSGLIEKELKGYG